jgi:hypothetical protein
MPYPTENLNLTSVMSNSGTGVNQLGLNEEGQGINCVLSQSL